MCPVLFRPASGMGWLVQVFGVFRFAWLLDDGHVVYSWDWMWVAVSNMENGLDTG